MIRKFLLGLALSALATTHAMALSDTDTPTKIPVPWGASAASPANIRVVPIPSQVGITAGAASFTTGFPPLNFLPVSGGGVPPFGQDMNGAFNAISAWSRWQNAGAPIFYDGTFSSAITGYPKGAVLSKASVVGEWWVNTADNNTSNPDSSGANWITANAAEIQLQTGNFALDSGSANAITVTLNPAAASLAAIKGAPVRALIAHSTTSTTPSLIVNGNTCTIVNPTGSALISGQIQAGSIAEFIYDGTNCEVQSGSQLGTMAVQNANAVAITGGTVAGVGLSGATITGSTLNSSAIGGASPSTGLFTTIGANSQITSTVSTGTAPFVVASTTVVSNLNVSLLQGNAPSAFLQVANNGSDINSPSAFRTALGLGTIATQAANNVAISGGTVDGTVIGGGSAAAITGTTIAGTAVTGGNVTDSTLGSGPVISNSSGLLANGGTIFIQDQRTSGTSPQTFTGGTWITRNLNTVVFNSLSGASLTSNQVTLPACTYQVDASAPGDDVTHIIRIQNITDSSTILLGSSSDSNTSMETHSILNGVFTISGTKVLQLQHWASGGEPAGVPTSNGTMEVYGQIRFTCIGK